MYDAKTKETDNSVRTFLETVESEAKKADAYRLIEIFQEETGFEPKLWGPSIIGFGKYHYRYASGHEGDAPLVAFSPRKGKISLYLMYDSPERNQLLASFGKHKTGKACVYINKLDDVDQSILKELIRKTVDTYQKLYPE
ncbi:DUF1801 domain-containing protein [Alkalibacterium thalassium]|uniref:YdhG-like domain-containing protein n=1 Tax=Alkalibacterium thalassium TaxID=426701 RepID=A0A1G9A8L3_9LACT|nr:DUF1801 domain-containing protein [Alkalibacterium thalassium]SDK23647.1 protein of unknown function (DU1801) [Alkalibacterium thalassium]